MLLLHSSPLSIYVEIEFVYIEQLSISFLDSVFPTFYMSFRSSHRKFAQFATLGHV